MVLQKQFERKIIGSFHGLWSAGGIVGIGITTLFIALNVSMQTHLIIVSITMVITALIAYPFLLHNDRPATGNKLIIGKPDPYLAYLGILIFFAGICEGGMFDWSGLYFKEVVGEEIFTLGYLSFMICMTLSRFASDWLMETLGMVKMFILSALLIVSGILLAILLPYFWTSLAGFCLAGVGVAAVIPMTLILASGSKKYSPGMAISIVTTYSLVGVFIGPPLVGFIAHAFNLQIGFLFFVLCGLMLIPISQLFFRHQRSVEEQHV